MYSVLTFLMKYMFIGFLLVHVCKTALVHFHLLLELELFPFDMESSVARCVAGQLPGIELLNFFGHQYQT